MSRLIKLNLRNIFHNKLFYVCLGLSLLLNVGVSFFSEVLFKSVGVNTKALESFTSIFISGVDMIAMIFITLYCTFDFSEGTTKNIIARGYSKTKLLISKYIASLIGVLVIILISALLSFVLYIKNGLGYNSSIPLSIVVGLIGIVAYTALYVTVAFSLEKTSSSIIANMFIPNIAMLVIRIADSNLHVKMSKYWLGNVNNTFISNPTVSNMTFPIVMYLIYIIFFTLIGIQIAKNKEIK